MSEQGVKPREFWIQNSQYPISTATKVSAFNPEVNPQMIEIHVIEYSAYEQLERQKSDLLGMLDTIVEEARSLADTESIELESFSAAEELVILLSRTHKEEMEARSKLGGWGNG